MMANGKDPERPRAPHWMRSMEEKYQRLHSRVTDQAVRYSQSKNSLSARIRELRQRKYSAPRGRAQSKSSCDNPKDPSLSPEFAPERSPNRSLFISSAVELSKTPTQNIKPFSRTDKSDGPRGSRVDVGLGSGTNDVKKRSASATALTSTSSEAEKKTALPDNTNRPFIQEPSGNASSIIDANDDKALSDGPNEFECGADEDGNRIISSSFFSDKNICDKEYKVQDKTDFTERSKESECTPRPYSTPRIRKSTLHTNPVNEGRNRKKGSNVMSRSPPGRKMNSKSASSLLPGRQSEVRRVPVFSSMSREAQHAKHETLKEMTSADTTHLGEGYIETSDGSFKPVNDGAEECNITETNMFNNDDRPTGCDDFIQDTAAISDKSVSSPESDITTPSVDPMPYHSRSFKQRLKATPCDPGKQQNDVQRTPSPKHYVVPKKQHGERLMRTNCDYTLPYRHPLPAIRQLSDWQPQRESSFNITSPDFDVRFCGNSAHPPVKTDDPPEDIRRQSIEKCRLWLERQLGRL